MKGRNKMLNKSYMLIVILFATGLIAETVYIDGIEFQKIKGKWYHVFGSKEYPVNPDITSLKFFDSATSTEIDDFISNYELEVVWIDEMDHYDCQLSEGADPIYSVQDFLDDKLVEFALPNIIGEYFNTPNDSYYSNQWYHYNSSNPAHDINSSFAWDCETGESDIVIAILDAGVDISHNDINGNVWVNPGEDIDQDESVWDTGDINGVDDDGNGFVDDLVGWDWQNEDNTVVDVSHHGTNVTGILGAETNNNTGIAGVAGGWNPSPGSKLMICQIGDEYGPSSEAVRKGILYAASSGADVIQMSFGLGDRNILIQRALWRAYTAYGCIIVCASGNSGSSVEFPASNEYVIGVGATDDDDYRWSNSNFGTGLFMVAPGIDMYTTYNNNSYGNNTGTSFSAPLVSGVAALLLSYNSSYTNNDVKRILARSCEKIRPNNYPYNVSETYGSWNSQVGYGRLDAYITIAAPNAPTGFSISGYTGQHPYLSWNSNPEADIKQYVVYRLNADPNSFYVTGTHYTDDDVIIGPGTTINYYMKAKDYSNQLSDPSQTESIKGSVGKETIMEIVTPSEYNMYQNYPNPLNPVTTISYALPDHSYVRITVFDLLGKEIATLVSKTQDAGYKSVQWDASSVVSGVYFYQIVVGDFIETRKMVVLK